MFRTHSVNSIYALVLLSVGVGLAQSPVPGSSQPITLNASAVSASAGKSLTFQATLAATKSGNTARISGVGGTRVTFFDRATILGTAPVNGQGEASLSTAWLTAGKHWVYAVAPGGAKSQATEIAIQPVASSSFGTAKQFAAGLTPNAMAIADFNGDGHLDIALAGAGGISVLPGHGDGTFGAPVPTTTAFQPTAIAAGDFDGDGVMDLAVTDGTTGKIYFLRGGGDGTFAAPRVLATGTNPVALAIGDFNWDGIADLAVADQAGNTVLLLLGKGDGSFRAPVRIQAGVAPAALAVGDFNSDGIADLAVANFGSNDVTILLGKGDGTFPSSASLKVGNGPAAVLMSDLNGDGIEDLAVLNRLDATATVFYGKGDGTFQSGINLPAGSTPIGIAASDPDKNGFRALLVADGSKLRWQQLAASSAQRVVQLDAGAAANGIAVGDFTGDGRSGVVIGAQGAVVWHPRDAGTAYYIRFSCPATASSGQSFNCFVGAYDQFNGAAVGFTDTVQFSSSDGSATLPGNTTIPTPADFNFTLVTPGTDTITAADITNDLPWPTIGGSIIVQPPAATHFSVSATTPVTAGSASTVTVTALTAGNATATGYSGTLQLTSTDGQATGLLSSATLTSGVGIFSVTLKTAGSQTVTAADTVTPGITGTSNNITVNAASASSFVVTPQYPSLYAGYLFHVTVTAHDQFGNTATGYAGTVRFTSTDIQATLPANSTLIAGTHVFSNVTLGTVGSQTVTATDASTPSISGTSAAITVRAGIPASVQADSGTPQSAVVGTAFPTPLIVTVLDHYHNVVNSALVIYHLPVTGASAVLPRTEQETNVSGMATITATANLVPGTFQVHVTAEGEATNAPAMSPRGEMQPATFSLTNLPNVTIQTSPAGLAFSVDGTSYTSSQSFGFALNSTHTIAVISPQPGASELQYTLSGWSDNGAASHTITATGTAVTYTATLLPKYQLTTSVSPAAGGTVDPASGNFYNAGATVPLMALKNAGYRFDHWSGVANSSKNAVTSIVMNGPESVTAVFALVNAQVSPGVLYLQYDQGAKPSSATGTLSVTTSDNSAFSVVAADAWLTVSSSSVATPATATVTANVSGMNPGTYNSSLTFSFSDGGARMIPVTLTVLGVPQLLWTGNPSGPLNFTVPAGSTAVQSRDIIVSASSHNVPLRLAVSMSSPAAGHWLSISPYGNNNGTTPQDLHVRLDPSGLAAGVYQGTITATSTTAGISPLTIPVTLTLTALPPAISVSLIQNAASFSTGSEAPNTILTAFGVYPGCISSAQVSVDGSPTEVFYSSSTQINFLLPPSVSGEQSASLQIQCGGLKSPMLKLPVLNVQPAIFTVGQNGSGQAAIVNQDGSLATATPPGTYIQIYGTGFGMLKPAGPDGLCWLELPVTATVGGMPAKVLFAGQAPGSTTGLQQINVMIPMDAPRGAAVPLQLTIGGANTPVGITLTIQ